MNVGTNSYLMKKTSLLNKLGFVKFWSHERYTNEFKGFIANLFWCGILSVLSLQLIVKIAITILMWLRNSDPK